MVIEKVEEVFEKEGLGFEYGENTKVMRFRKRGGGNRKLKWWWRGKKLEEVKEAESGI